MDTGISLRSKQQSYQKAQLYKQHKQLLNKMVFDSEPSVPAGKIHIQKMMCMTFTLESITLINSTGVIWMH